MCNCRLCTEHRRIQMIAESGDTAAMRKLINELEELASNQEFDLEVHQAIFDGSWPTANEYAMSILGRWAARQLPAPKKHGLQLKISSEYIPF